MPRRQLGASGQHRRDLNREPTIAEIEREVLHMAYIVERYGERYAPILDSLVFALDDARRWGGSPTERAKRILDDAAADGRLAAVNITRKR